MNGPASLDDRLDDFRRDLDLMEQAFDKAKKRLAGEDKEWEERKGSLIRQICTLLSGFKIGDEPHKAVAIVAQASIMANELRMPEYWVAQYKEKEQLMRMAQSEMDRVTAAEEKAKEAYENQPWRKRAAAL
jgi:hypothetical protein